MTSTALLEGHKNCTYTAWVYCLYNLFEKIKMIGWLSIEDDINKPFAQESVFNQYPLTLKEPYLSLVIDLFNQNLSGYDTEWCLLYSTHAKHGLLYEQKNINCAEKVDKRLMGKSLDEPLINLITLFYQQGLENTNYKKVSDLARTQTPINNRISREELFLNLLKIRVHVVN